MDTRGFTSSKPLHRVDLSILWMDLRYDFGSCRAEAVVVTCSKLVPERTFG